MRCEYRGINIPRVYDIRGCVFGVLCVCVIVLSIELMHKINCFYHDENATHEIVIFHSIGSFLSQILCVISFSPIQPNSVCAQHGILSK